MTRQINQLPISLFVVLIILIIASASCQSSLKPGTLPATSGTTITPTQSPEPPLTPTYENILPPYSLWIEPVLPASLVNEINSLDNIVITPEKSSAQVSLSLNGDDTIGYWYYLAVAPFFSPLESIQSDEFFALWHGMSSNLDKIYLNPDTKHFFSSTWGGSDSSSVEVIETDRLLSTLWENPGSIAIIPFEDLEPRWKVLPIDENDPLSSDFSPDTYLLSIPLKISIKEGLNPSISYIQEFTNFDRLKLTSIALTGVTALVRDTAAIMEEKGILYPSLDIGALLSNVDITHISNEVPFAEDCPSPDPNQESLYFCSKDEYIQLLEAVGTDIVELSGDHFGDWGPDAMLHSLDLYGQRNWLTYGGGENLQAGLDPAFINHNGNQFAFIGCNGKAHDKYATASETNPGASRCDFEWMTKKIKNLTELGYLVIATMQHEEVDSFYSIAIQQYDFRRLADSGAVIVSGSQAHHPQAVEFYNSSFIHYGLGNLFFDQWHLAQYNPDEHINKDKSFIDIHYFYDGSYINSHLVPLQFIDNARPRLMTPEEKVYFLDLVFNSSVWNVHTE